MYRIDNEGVWVEEIYFKYQCLFHYLSNSEKKNYNDQVVTKLRSV